MYLGLTLERLGGSWRVVRVLFEQLLCVSRWLSIVLPFRAAVLTQARSQGGGFRDPQAIQGIVNTLFWLYCGFNFSESKNQTTLNTPNWLSADPAGGAYPDPLTGSS